MRHFKKTILLTITAVLILSTTSCRQEKEADYVLEAAVLSGEFNGAIGDNGEYNYYIHISDKGFSPDGRTHPNGTYYRLDLFSSAPRNPDIISVPTGTYVLGPENTTACGTFTSDYSSFFTNCPKGLPETVLNFSHGTLNISQEDDTYTFDAYLTDISGMTHRVRYKGPVHLTDKSEDTIPDYMPLKDDIGINGYALAAIDYGPVDGFRNIVLSLTDMHTDDGKHVIPPGCILTLDCYMPVDELGIIPGRYDISDLWGMKDYTMSPGEESNGQYVGSHVQLFKDGKPYLGILSSGTAYIDRTVTDGTTVYTIETELRTSSGNTVLGYYKGRVKLTAAQPETTVVTGNTCSRPVFNPITRSHFILRTGQR